MIILVLFLFGCATISLKQSTTEILIKQAADEAGYQIGKREPALAKEFLKYTEDLLKNEKTLSVSWEYWREHVANLVTDDEHSASKIKLLLELIDIEFKDMDSSSERMELIKGVFEQFLRGLKVGIHAGS